MNKSTIVTINGRGYDAHTGLPVEASEGSTTSPAKKVAANDIHSQTQKSQTLNRRSTKKPEVKKQPITAAPPRRRSMDIARSNSITRFAPHPVMNADVKKAKEAIIETPDIGPVAHPNVVKAHAAALKKKPVPQVVAQKSSKDIKEEAIQAALALDTPKEKQKRSFAKHRKFLNIFGIIVIVILIGGYVTYINLPNLSVHIAAARAGISASYPTYVPDGYSVNGPVTYTNGNVVISFKANTGDGKFTITQTKSSWDSTALQQQVSQASNNQFITTQAQGLTVYSYGGDASWVNGGILYKIQGTGSMLLSSDQIVQIATSM